MSKAKRKPASTAGFPVGQRVRVVKTDSEEARFLYGLCGTVASKPEPQRDGRRRWRGQLVVIDELGSEITDPQDTSRTWAFTPPPENLEPIDDYDGRKATTWDSCCWHPAAIGANR